MTENLGIVYETRWSGIPVAVALKRKYIPQAITSEQLKEVDILKKLRHHHVVRVVASYTQSKIFGLLLWPVAVCDLSVLLDDVDFMTSYVWSQRTRSSSIIAREGLASRWTALDLDRQTLDIWIPPAQRLYKCFGCLVNGIAYLHSQNIRHKDLKPSNVLITLDGLRLTDFDRSTDFSLLETSQTENGERGTPKYFAPEVFDFQRYGRSADMFSLGCIFMEITISYSMSSSLENLRGLRSAGDRSFQANLDRKTDWFALKKARSAREQALLHQISQLLDPMSHKRPTALELQSALAKIELLPQERHYEPLPFFGRCCTDVTGG